MAVRWFLIKLLNSLLNFFFYYQIYFYTFAANLITHQLTMTFKKITVFLVLMMGSFWLQAQETPILQELNGKLQTAIENNNKKEIEALKKEIQFYENKNKRLSELEEDKQIAVFNEDYDRVIAIENEVKALQDVKYGEVVDNSSNKTSNTLLTNDISTTNSSKSKNKKPTLPLTEYAFNEKVIGQFGIGFKSVNETYFGETYSEFVMSYHFANSRWWVNKYLAGGMFYDFTFGDYIDLSVGPQMTAFADFDAILLPYTSLGIGFGLDDDGETYLPVVYKLGSHLFFKQERNIGLFFELNLSLAHSYEYMPAYRFGLSWSRVKRKYK